MSPYRTPAPPPSPPPRDRGRLAPLALLIALASWTVWCSGGQRRALLAMPELERTELLQRTLDNLELCARRRDDDHLRSFCRAQAELAIDFPACDARCHSLARLGAPSRAPLVGR